MKTQTLVQFVADDGAIFDTAEKCELYENKCSAYKALLASKVISFWSNLYENMNEELLNDFVYKGVDYLNWLTGRLKPFCNYIVIDQYEETDDCEVIWDFLVKRLLLSPEDVQRIKPFYKAGDLLVYDPQDSCFHNIDVELRYINDLKQKLCIKEECHK